MKRHIATTCTATAALFTGCQTSPADPAPAAIYATADHASGAHAVDAWLLGKPRVAEASSSAEPRTLAPESVTAELLAAGIRCIEEQARVVSANIANANTPAYKRQFVKITTANIETGGHVYQVPVVQSVDTVFAQGALEVTERCLDVGIDGAGFFSLILPNGQVAYTRDGSFHVDADGKLVTGAGHTVTPMITVPADTLEVAVDPEGRVSGRTAGAPEANTQFGQLQLHRFVNPGGMLAVGDNVMRPTDASGHPMTGTPGSQGLGTLKQGFREGSNVNMAKELVDLQLLMKQQEMLTKVLAHFGMIAP